jgi:hypothetical protein
MDVVIKAAVESSISSSKSDLCNFVVSKFPAELNSSRKSLVKNDLNSMTSTPSIYFLSLTF